MSPNSAPTVAPYQIQGTPLRSLAPPVITPLLHPPSFSTAWLCLFSLCLLRFPLRLASCFRPLLFARLVVLRRRRLASSRCCPVFVGLLCLRPLPLAFPPPSRLRLRVVSPLFCFALLCLAPAPPLMTRDPECIRLTTNSDQVPIFFVYVVVLYSYLYLTSI